MVLGYLKMVILMCCCRSVSSPGCFSSRFGRSMAGVLSDLTRVDGFCSLGFL